MSKPDLDNLRRVIELGCADACRDAGLKNFAINVRIAPLSDGNVLAVDVITLTEEQAAELREIQRQLDAETTKQN